MSPGTLRADRDCCIAAAGSGWKFPMQSAPETVPAAVTCPDTETGPSGLVVTVEASGQHPADSCRAVAPAVSRLIEEIIDTT
ncbi:hypothetical protein [Pseudarthrobacter sp. N5]|uniref:hypothetical protein n=1 Tax=Pseudarthrobacter sp. N5 TaxID=3418416 RepID=UPI003CEC10ED